MGKEIVYCGDCGKSLREDDFSRGKAQHLDHRPYCIDCKPLAAAPPSQIQTSSKLAAMKTTTGRHAPAPAPSTRRRRSEEDTSRTPLLVGGLLVFAAFLLLIVFAFSSGGRSPAPEEPPAPAPHAGPPKPASKPPVPAPDADKAAAVMKELDAIVAASAPPVAVLQRCEELRPVVQGTPHESRLKGIEDRARESRRVQQLDASLEEVKKLRALDPAYERKEEIVRLLNATLPVSGTRRPEVEETLRRYQRDAQAYVPPAPVPAAVRFATPPSAEALGPYDIDAAGNVNHWLVLGPFKNRNDLQGMYDHDLLRTEMAHIPSAGHEVTTREGTKVRWTPAVVSDGKLELSQVLGDAARPGVPMIAFAACWVVAENDLEVKFRMFADLGFMLYLDGQRFRNQPQGHKYGEDEDVLRVKLSAGPHLFLFKLASPAGPPYLRLRLTQLWGERMKGLRIWNQAPVARTVIYAQSFADGIDGFSGTLEDDGGCKALLVGLSAARDRVFKAPITPQTTLRFKVKPLNDLQSFQVVMWSNKVKQNYWYHVRNARKGEWTTVEFKLSDARGGYGMNGPSPLDDLPTNLGFHAEGAAGIQGRALLKDLEVSE